MGGRTPLSEQTSKMPSDLQRNRHGFTNSPRSGVAEIKLWINTVLSTSIVNKRCTSYTDNKCEVHHYNDII